MKEISKIIVFATFCLGIVNVSYAEEYKAFACYNKPSTDTDRFLEYEFVLGSESSVDGLDSVGAVTVNNKRVRWSFDGNNYQWELFSHDFLYYADNEKMWKKRTYSSKWQKIYCDRVDATLLLHRIKKIKASKKLF